MVNVLADITGPGTLGLQPGDPQNFLIVSGKLAKLQRQQCSVPDNFQSQGVYDEF